MASKKSVKFTAKAKKISGSILLVVGIVLIVFGSIVSGKVNQGRRKIRKAQKSVNVIRDVSGASGYTRGIGKAASNSAQKKINKGKRQAGTFKGLSIVFLVVGIVCVSSGASILYLGYEPKKRK